MHPDLRLAARLASFQNIAITRIWESQRLPDHSDPLIQSGTIEAYVVDDRNPLPISPKGRDQERFTIIDDHRHFRKNVTKQLSNGTGISLCRTNGGSTRPGHVSFHGERGATERTRTSRTSHRGIKEQRGLMTSHGMRRTGFLQAYGEDAEIRHTLSRRSGCECASRLSLWAR